ncbi:MAG TPA: VanZ family protein [Nitrospiraceae bacterium]|nr:VanZ family protein [Nitrospiraceae bacterium]
MLRLAITVASYTGLLTLLAVASPGVGLIGAVITIVPDELRGWSHVPLYGGLAWLVIHSFQVRGWPTGAAGMVGASFSMLFGLGTELAQISAPGREPSSDDLLFDGLGITVAAALVSLRAVMWRSVGRAALTLGFRPAALSLDRSAR